MEFPKKILSSLNLKNAKNKILASCFVLLGLLALVSGREEPKPDSPVPSEKAAHSADTFIPRGYVLVPIEVANAGSLSSLLGDVGGVVDLYLAQGTKASRKVASKLKILRAPLNPDMYAVLVRESESSQLLRFTGPFIAVVQNPEAQGQKVGEAQKRLISIEYQN